MPRVTPGSIDRKWEIEDAMRTLSRAECIRKDAKLMKEVRTLASDLTKVVGRSPRSAPKRSK